EEVRRAWIADRPVAFVFGQLKDRATLADWDDIFDQFRFWLDVRLISMRWGKSCVAANARPCNSHQRRMGSWLALAGRRGRWAFGAPGQAEPMHLSDHRIAGNAAEFRRNLTRRQSIAPQLLEEVYTVVCPAHGPPPLAPGQSLGRIPPRPPDGRKAAGGDASHPNHRKPAAEDQTSKPTGRRTTRDIVSACDDATIWGASRARAGSHCHPHLRPSFGPKPASHPQLMSGCRCRRMAPWPHGRPELASRP